MTQQTYAPVLRTVTVDASQERAFTVFTERFGTWWPQHYSIGGVGMTDFVLETKVGGRWYQVGVDGKERDTGRVTAYEPPERLTLAWQIDGSWQYDPDPDHASEVEVRFIAEGPNRTTVELEHRGFERHGDGAEAVYNISSPAGWTYLLEQFAKKVTA